MNLNKLIKALALAGLIGSGAAQAALVDRGGGMLYDDVLNITWLQDANYAKTSGYDSDGYMTWSEAKTWADNLTYGGYSDWRLASNTPVGANWNYVGNSFDGTADIGYNITSPNSELSYMFYVNLGLKGMYSATGVYQPDYGVIAGGPWDYQKDVGLVKNLGTDYYWSGTAWALIPDEYAWAFFTGSGFQRPIPSADIEFSAWAVRPGDVATVPEPGSALLVGLGLAGLAALRRRRLPSVSS